MSGYYNPLTANFGSLGNLASHTLKSIGTKLLGTLAPKTAETMQMKNDFDQQLAHMREMTKMQTYYNFISQMINIWGSTVKGMVDKMKVQ